MNFINNLKKLRSEINNNIKLIAVSKKQSFLSIETLYKEGQKDFGENYVQELIYKHKKLPKDIRWHMIGKIQSNKLKYIAPFIYMIHSIEKLKHLQILEQEAAKYNRIIYCLLQVKISKEPLKSGIDINQILNLINNFKFFYMPHIKISGLMGIATFTQNKQILNKEFNILKKLFEKINKNNSEFKILSMGMSSDYLLAINYGSNMIRIGSKLFGNRL